MRYYQPKQVKPFWLWVEDIREGLQLEIEDADTVAHNSWPRLSEEEKDLRKQVSKEIKSFLREYPGQGVTYNALPLPEFMTNTYSHIPKKNSRIWDQVKSEKALGIAEDWSDLDHYLAVKGDRRP